MFDMKIKTVLGDTMRRFVIVMMLLFVLVLSMIVQGQREDGKLEYANIQFDSFGVWFWKEPTLYAEGEELDDLFDNLSIRVSASDNADLYTLVNWAGKNGWELVSMDQRVSFTSVWFKRQF
jgi:hypothetical protein